jgi:hypothetical protein
MDKNAVGWISGSITAETGGFGFQGKEGLRGRTERPHNLALRRRSHPSMELWAVIAALGDRAGEDGACGVGVVQI